MRNLPYYFFSGTESVLKSFISFYKIFYWTLRYPGLKISFKSHISSGAKIKVIKGARVNIGKVFLGKGVTIFAEAGSNIIIKQNVFIGHYTTIVAREKITIEENVQIAEFVTIRDQNHNVNQFSLFEVSPIHIGSNVWLGAKVTVAKGVKIADGTVVGAHAFVNKSISVKAVVAGVPAKIVKQL